MGPHKPHQELEDLQPQSRAKERSLQIAVVVTFLSLIPTIYAMYQSNSVVLAADFLRCGAEFVAIVISWLIVRRVARGDSTHFDYGFGKLEQLGSLAVATAMLVSFLVVVLSALYRVLNPVPVEDFTFGLWLSILSVVGNVTYWQYGKILARKQVSPVLESQWRLFRAKAVASAIVTISLLCSHWGGARWTVYADPIGSLLLALFLLYSAVALLSTSMRDLLDCSVDEALSLLVLTALVKHEAQYSGLKSIRSRRVGSKPYVEIGLEFDETLELAEVHRRSEQIRSEIALELKDADISIVPFPLGAGSK